jgi:hypothetical protein
MGKQRKWLTQSGGRMVATTGVTLNTDAAAMLRELSYSLSVKQHKRVSLSETVKIAVDAVNAQQGCQEQERMEA